MHTIGVVSPGAMGSALARAWRAAGSRVVVTLEGRSDRTRALAGDIEQVPDLRALVTACDIVVSVVPPGAARATMAGVAAAAAATGVAPLVADLNAVSPATVEELAATAAASGLDLVDGAISGGPPQPGDDTTLYLSGERTGELASLLAADGLTPRVVGSDPGSASAVKMCTASVYKGSTALWAQALQTADAHGVVDTVLADLGVRLPRVGQDGGAQARRVDGKAGASSTRWSTSPAPRRPPAPRPELFEGVGAVYRRLSRTPLAELLPSRLPVCATWLRCSVDCGDHGLVEWPTPPHPGDEVERVPPCPRRGRPPPREVGQRGRR